MKFQNDVQHILSRASFLSATGFGIRRGIGMLLVSYISSTCPAGVVMWTGSGDGVSFANALNWNPALVPGTLDTSLFDLIGGSVSFSTGTQTLGLTVNRAPVVLNLPPGLLQDYTVSGQMIVGNLAGDIASLTLFDGTLLVQDTPLVSDVHIGFAAGSSGQVTASTGATFNTMGVMKVGESGSGDFTVINGGQVLPQITFVGDNPGATGSVSVTGPGSSWTSTLLGDLFIGNAGNGTLALSGGGSITVPILFVADNAGSVSSASIDGLGTTLTTTNKLFVGNGGTGTLNLTHQAHIISGSATIGDDLFSQGTITVDGAGTQWDVTLGITIGSEGDGTLNIINGGTVTSLDGFLGRQNFSSGSITVDGPGSTWTMLASLKVADSASSTLNITNGGVVTVPVAAISNNGAAVGMVNVSGIGSRLNATTSVAVGHDGPGVLNLTGGGSVSSGTGFVGKGLSSSGVVTVQGPGTTWSSAGSTIVGNFGDGEFTLTNQGAATTGGVIIGDELLSTGIITVDGTGASWNSTGGFIIGDWGSGALNIINGGAVTSGSLSFVGDDSGGSGSVLVAGPGSTWNLALELVVGNLGTGTALVTNAGAVTTSRLTVGDGLLTDPTAQGAVTVDGPAATWTDNLNVIVGNFATGTIQVNNGGTFNSVQATLGDDPGASGVVNVDGPGSSWNSSLALIVGNLGFGALNLTNGAMVSSPQIFLGFGGSTAFGDAVITGASSLLQATTNLSNGDFGGAGSLRLVNGGRVAVSGVYDQGSTGALEVILSPKSIGAPGLTAATANLNGILKLGLQPGYIPPMGTQFTLLSAPVVTGVFSAIAAPSGLSVTYQFDAVVITVIGPVTPRCLPDCTPINPDGSVGNGVVNIDDLVALLSAFSSPGGLCDTTPVNANGTVGNGAVNIDDLVALLNAFGACP